MKADGLARIRTLMAKKDLKWPRTDDSFLLRFLRARKYKIEKAFEVLVNYTKFANENPEVFKDLTAASVRKVYEMNFSQVLRVSDV